MPLGLVAESFYGDRQSRVSKGDQITFPSHGVAEAKDFRADYWASSGRGSGAW
jgi:hypothetical protein